jgi:Peptidase family M48
MKKKILSLWAIFFAFESFSQQEVKILNVKPAFITFLTKPLTEVSVDIEDDLTGYFSKLEVNDTTMVFRDKSEFSSYESKAKKAQKTPVDNSKFLVENRNLLRTGLEVEVHFYEYRISKRNIIRYIIIKTKLSGSDNYEGVFEGIKGDLATIDGKSVRLKSGSTIEGDKGFKGQNFTSFDQMMIGSVVKVSGQRQADGTLMADRGKAWENAETKDDSKLKLTLQKTKKLTSVEVNFGGAKFNLLKNPSLLDYVNRVGRSVVPAYQRELPKGHPVKIDFNFYIVEDSTFNACAYPDGTIFIHTALLTQMENEAQLASVLGHEIAHTTYEHARLQMQKERVISSLTFFTNFATVAGIIPAELGMLVSAFGGPALSSKYGRDFEEQADRAGLTYMSQAGYDPREAAKIWKRLVDRTEPQEANFGADVERAFAKGINSIYSSHPDAQKRYKTLSRLIALNYYDQNFDNMKTNAKEYKQQMKALGRWLKMKGTTIYEAEPVAVQEPKTPQNHVETTGPTTQKNNKKILPSAPSKEPTIKKKPKS